MPSKPARPASAAGASGGPRTPPPPSWPLPAEAVQTTWIAVVAADRAYYEAVIREGGADPTQVPFPPYCPERRFPLGGTQVRIGRRSVSRDYVPEIDLSQPPADPGISHLHVVLLPRADGWILVDPGSTNGTIVNDSLPIAHNVEVPLRPGDRLHIGAWTAITLRKE